MRTYQAILDNGRDYFNFTYESNHKAGSKANKEDALYYYNKKHGHHYTDLNMIKNVELVPEGTEFCF